MQPLRGCPILENTREWFAANEERFESDVKRPALQFIVDFGPHLHRISPHFRADPRPVGGSLFRIYRDVRFSRDQSPYKTHAGLHFRHEAGKTSTRRDSTCTCSRERASSGWASGVPTIPR